jgi:hypothetical protein
MGTEDSRMLLSAEPSLGRDLRTAFTIFAVFWAVVLAVLYLGIGVLLGRHDRASGHGDKKH